MKTTDQHNHPFELDPELVQYDLVTGFEEEPARALSIVNLFLVDPLHCSGRLGWLKAIASEPATRLDSTPLPLALPEDLLHALVEPGLYPAYSSGQLSAEFLTKLAGRPEWLQRAHDIVLASISGMINEYERNSVNPLVLAERPKLVRLPRVFHLALGAAAYSLQEPVDDQLEIAVRGHRTIVNVHSADDSDWTVQLQSRQPEVARECRVSVVLLKADSEEPDTEELVCKDSDEEVSGWPVAFREMPDGWFLGSVTFCAEDILREVGSQSFQIGLRAAEAGTESDAKSGLTESETPTSLLSDVDTRVVAQSPSKIIEQVLSRKALISRLLKWLGVASDQSSEFCEFAQAKSKDWVGGDLRKTLLQWCHHYAQEQGLEVPAPELSNEDWQSLIVNSSIQAIVGRHFTNEPEWKQEIRGILTQSNISIADDLLMVTIPARLTDHRGFDVFRSNLYIELQNEISLVQQLLGLSIGVETPECQTDRNHQETD